MPLPGHDPLLARLLAPADDDDGGGGGGGGGCDAIAAVSLRAPTTENVRSRRSLAAGGQISFAEAFPDVDVDLSHLSSRHNRFNCNGPKQPTGHSFAPHHTTQTRFDAGHCDERCTKLDQALWEWEETDQDGKDSAPFTSAGIIASANARFILFVVGLVIVGWFGVIIYSETTASLRDIGSISVGLIGTHSTVQYSTAAGDILFVCLFVCLFGCLFVCLFTCFCRGTAQRRVHGFPAGRACG